MKTSKTQKQEWIEKLIVLVFEKAKEDSMQTTANGLSEYLSEQLEKDNLGVIDKRTFNRYHDQYISEKKKRKTNPNNGTLDILSKYCGNNRFIEFIEKNENGIEKIKRLFEEKMEIIKRRLSFSIISSLLLLILLSFFISKYYKKNCMIWVEDHYEKIRCSGLDTERKLDEVVLENLRKVAVCDTTPFFKNGEPVIHYLKYKNQIEFFTYHGEHPIYEGKFLDPITETIINGHVQPCDSVIRQ